MISTKLFPELNRTFFLRFGLLILVITIFFKILYAGAQIDEVSYIDPGVNLATENGFTSTVAMAGWPDRIPFTNWGSSNPGMPLLYALWFKVFGFGLIQSKILSSILYFSGVYLLVNWFSKKFDVSPDLKIGLAISLLILPSSSWIAVSCRPDILSFLFFAWFLIFFILQKVRGLTGLVLCCSAS